ncbi:FAD-dependent monooxygenase [Nocardia sp. CDC159]|uniref:FAD-dependent monooxygenase n=1 Tax=Nocardia pulmonis TaxID=2951408 RepID=A0A9X2E1P5_9NOCA|nr:MULTISPECIES: FAD-dependent monooxygenase [Nocardia]MCM6772587.1 FAD-dependent monooxygenase [Nocardia pulmonis]MCM6784755.1 FAD-dependent monooxygenase [Nocardia sp. CDC159]
MAPTSPPRVIVIGAGIGGLAAAISLNKLGIDVEIYERATELKPVGFGLSVGANAISALRSIGLDLRLAERGRTLETYRIFTSGGTLLRSLPIAEAMAALPDATVQIGRPDLQRALLDAAAGIPLHLGSAATGFETASDSGPVRVRFADGRSAEGDALVGADGVRSAIRRGLVGPHDEERYGGYVAWLALAPFAHPRFPPGSANHYWAKGKRFGIIDIGGGRAYWWGTEEIPEPTDRTWKPDKDRIVRTFADWPEEVRAVIDTTPADAILGVPETDRPFLENWGAGPVTLLGDAAHPMLSSLGQGACMAIEDAVVLARSLAASTDPATGLRRYEDARRDRVRDMVALAHRVSRFEQGPTRLRAALRDTAVRLLPHRQLVRSLRAPLAFPDPSPGSAAPFAHLSPNPTGKRDDC